MNILVHTSFIGDTGYNNHARSFFTALNKHHNVKIRNYTVGNAWGGYSPTCHDSEPYMTDEMRNMLILQTLHNNDGSLSDYPLYGYDGKFKADVNIILNDVNHYYFYDNYDGYTIGYNVWESTEYPKDFFNLIQKFNEFWVPSEWQKENLIKQGYPANKIFVVPEGVDENTFYPNHTKSFDKFTFMLFGRWEYRKSTKEIIETFNKTFDKIDDVEFILCTDNVFANDGFKSTEERLKHFNLENNKLKVISFPKRNEYVNYLQNGDVFVSCARSEGWNLPLIEAMACGKPSIYSEWGAQLEFAKNLGIPVKTLHEIPANKQDPSFVGNYIEPDYNDLSRKMMDVYKNYKEYLSKSLEDSETIRNKFNWGNVANLASDRINKIKKMSDEFVFVTTGNIDYMPVISKLVESIEEFSKYKIIVYGVDCEVPINGKNVIKRKINPPKHSQYDKWYWKQYACIESLKEDFENYVWIDGDVVVNYNIDDIKKYFKDIENYPLSDIHKQEEFFAEYEYNGKMTSQLFNENICSDWVVKKKLPLMHVCLFIYNKNCGWWFNEIIDIYRQIPIEDYRKYLLWNDEGIDNYLRWKHNFTKHLPLINFDTSSYDGDNGQTENQLNDFYTFWNVEGPYNFNRIYGYQFVPKNKEQILYFHGNKNSLVSDKMIEFIKLKRDNNFYNSEYFWVSENKFKNLGLIKNIQGSTLFVADKFGWDYAIYHEIYNLQDYYYNKIKRIHEGDIVVDLGGNIGIFNRWAYSQGAKLVISFEPDKRYFKLLSMNSDPRSILFNAAMSDKVGTLNLYESSHLGGSNILKTNPSNTVNYPVRTYNLNYLFETNLIDRIDFLKIDIEGSEINVMNGISDENLLKIKNISIEYHHAHLNYDDDLRNNLISRLNKLGFNSYLLFCGNDNNLQLIYFWR